jgi:hypothetical protein
MGGGGPSRRPISMQMAPESWRVARPTPLGRPGRRVSNARRQQKDYSPEAPGSFLNDFSTASRNNIGSRSPPLANSIIRLATMLTAGSVRSIKPKECKVSSNAEVMTATSSGENASSPKKDRIGMPATPPAKPRCLLPHLAGGLPRDAEPLSRLQARCGLLCLLPT